MYRNICWAQTHGFIVILQIENTMFPLLLTELSSYPYQIHKWFEMAIALVVFLSAVLVIEATLPQGPPKVKACKIQTLIATNDCCIGRRMLPKKSQFRIKMRSGLCYDGYCDDGEFIWSEPNYCTSYLGGCWAKKQHYEVGDQISYCKSDGLCMKSYCKAPGKVRGKVVTCQPRFD